MNNKKQIESLPTNKSQIESLPTNKSQDHFSLSKSRYLVTAAILAIWTIISEPTDTFKFSGFFKKFNTSKPIHSQGEYFVDTISSKAKRTVFNAYENYKMNPSSETLKELKETYIQWEKFETRATRENPPFPDKLKTTAKLAKK